MTPRLQAVDDVVRAGLAEHGAVFHRARVVAAYRFGQARRRFSARRHRHEVLCFWCLRAELEQPVGIELSWLTDMTCAVAGVGLADLDHRQDVGQGIHAHAAVLPALDAHKA